MGSVNHDKDRRTYCLRPVEDPEVCAGLRFVLDPTTEGSDVHTGRAEFPGTGTITLLLRQDAVALDRQWLRERCPECGHPVMLLQPSVDIPVKVEVKP